MIILTASFSTGPAKPFIPCLLCEWLRVTGSAFRVWPVYFRSRTYNIFVLIPWKMSCIVCDDASTFLPLPLSFAGCWHPVAVHQGLPKLLGSIKAAEIWVFFLEWVGGSFAVCSVGFLCRCLQPWDGPALQGVSPRKRQVLGCRVISLSAGRTCLASLGGLDVWVRHHGRLLRAVWAGRQLQPTLRGGNRPAEVSS